MNERIRLLREDKALSRAAFGEKLGVSGDVINNLERGRVEPKEHIIKLICAEFSVSEKWLRHGTGSMYIQPNTFSLDDFVKQHGGTELEIDIMKAYFELSPDVREMLVQHFKSRLTASRAEPAAMTVEEAEAAYIKSRSDTAQKTGLSASSSTADASKTESGTGKASNL